jgi:hypothetical protein
MGCHIDCPDNEQVVGRACSILEQLHWAARRKPCGMYLSHHTRAGSVKKIKSKT